MNTVENGLITQLSVSQVTAFDHKQTGGCGLRWWFERAKDLRPDQSEAQSEGDKGHELLAHYFRTGESPKGRVKMGKAVTGAIVKGQLPAPGPDLRVESRFSGQPKFDEKGEWIPLDTSKTLWIGGVPWEGFIDLAFLRGGDPPEIWDHKFSSDIHAFSLPSSELINTVQLPVYVAEMQRHWSTTEQWRIVHHYVSKRGVDSLIRSAVISNDQVRERLADIENIVARMKSVAPVELQTDVPYNKHSCNAWNGCPHQSICKRYNERHNVQAQLTDDEKALFTNMFADIEPPVLPAKAKRELSISDEVQAPIPDSAPVATSAPCACGVTISKDNGSRLESGEWLHVGCKLNAPLGTPPKPRAPVKPKEPELPFVAETIRAVCAPLVTSSEVVEVKTLPAWINAAPTAPVTYPQAATPPRVNPSATARESLAALLECLANLVRSVQ